jgi:hypothetical protein
MPGENIISNNCRRHEIQTDNTCPINATLRKNLSKIIMNINLIWNIISTLIIFALIKNQML